MSAIHCNPVNTGQFANKFFKTSRETSDHRMFASNSSAADESISCISPWMARCLAVHLVDAVVVFPSNFEGPWKWS